MPDRYRAGSGRSLRSRLWQGSNGYLGRLALFLRALPGGQTAGRPWQQYHYVQMPLFANLGFGRERGGVKGFLVIGPQLGYCISESVREGARFLTPQVLVGDLTQHDLKVQKKFEYGIAGGLGMDVSTKKGHHFIIEGRYFFGLSDIFSSTKKDPFGRSANSTISAKVSYLFDIIKTKQ